MGTVNALIAGLKTLEPYMDRGGDSYALEANRGVIYVTTNLRDKKDTPKAVLNELEGCASWSWDESNCCWAFFT